MKFINSILLGVLALATSLGGSAQNKGRSVQEEIDKIQTETVTGTVLDENGDPLPGAVVKIEGTQTAVPTDIEGNFSIFVNTRKPVLTISYIGMKTYVTELEPNVKYIRVRLEPDATLMNEVVVTGYQNIKRENATGSYQVLSADDMDKRFTGDIVSNLEGKVPGVVVGNDRNKTGEDQILIRGAGTFNARTSPLVVVDGLPIEGGMNSVNPYDIENITILKDAAASAIYGARASNGVIVITTKRAKNERLSIDFNADLTISEKQKYDNYNWASAADIITLERNNFKAMLNEDPRLIQSNINDISRGRMYSMSKVMRLLLQNYQGQLSDTDLNNTLDRWSRNDYRREWQDLNDRTGIDQQYNLAMRVQGNTLSSSIVLNYNDSNRGVRGESDSSLSFKYSGDLKVAKWLDLSFGANVLNNRSKSHVSGMNDLINSFMAYESMYEPDGSLARMEADVYPGEPAFENKDYGLKDHTYNFAEERNYNMNKYRYTNVRTYVHALFKILPGWTAQGQFQYEDIYSRSETRYNKESYYVRDLYNLYTTSKTITEWVDDPNFDWNAAFMDPNTDWFDPNLGKMQVSRLQVDHAIPDGDILATNSSQSQYYTFRAQTRYNREFLGLHNIDVLAGFEYRQTHTTTDSDLLYGYDHQTQTNLNLQTDWAFINNPYTGVLGTNYTVGGAPKTFSTSDILHRYYSYYFTGNYVYDSRYSLSGSYRVDKADLFGTDPKFRGRPLWSVGASWNAHNEKFMRDFTWIDALKLRASYGLTGNIDSSVSSYLTARLSTNMYNGGMIGALITPPNDQLRWEKTSTWNAGVDFAFLGYRLNGSLDFYRKSGSDILTDTDLDPTTGWRSLRINSGKMTNTGVELQLDGHILQARTRKDLGISLGFNIAYNNNKVTGVSHYPASGWEWLSMSLHKGYPLNSLFSINYAGLIEQDGSYFVGWKDKDGNVHTESIKGGEFKVEDALFSGSYVPKISGSITPEIKWYGFTLSAMFNFYGGHYMRVDNDVWNNSIGNGAGYKSVFGNGAVSKDLLRYWNGDKDVPANGYMQIKNSSLMGGTLRHTNIEHADYVKLRNIVLSYNFDQRLCRKIGLKDLRLRFQVNNVATWARNSKGLDPEAVNLVTGSNLNEMPRSYTMSVFFNL